MVFSKSMCGLCVGLAVVGRLYLLQFFFFVVRKQKVTEKKQQGEMWYIECKKQSRDCHDAQYDPVSHPKVDPKPLFVISGVQESEGAACCLKLAEMEVRSCPLGEVCSRKVEG